MTEATQPQAAAGGVTAEKVTPGRANYALAILFLVLMLNFLDRQIVAILAEPIKGDLGLSDSQVGLMTGFSFALFYTTLAVPVAMLADRWNRPWIIGISVAFWSAMTALCGLAQNFVQLFAARAGVGIGEAGSGPASHALIADLFPPERRASAMGVLGAAIPLGALFAYTGGGWVVQNMDWRMAFFIAGAPGLIVAALAAFTLPEPRRGKAAPKAASGSLAAALRELAGKPTYWHLLAAATFIQFVAYGFSSFYGGFFVRIHGMRYDELGLLLGVMIGVVGALAAWMGGVVADRLQVKSPAWALIAPGLVLVASAPFFATGLFIDNKYAAIALIAAPTFAATFYYGPLFAAVQGLAQPRTRAMAAAIFLFISGLSGMGAGPLFTGALSDRFTAETFAKTDPAAPAYAVACAPAKGTPTDACRAASAAGLRQAILILSLFNVWAALHFFFAARSVRRDLVA